MALSTVEPVSLWHDATPDVAATDPLPGTTGADVAIVGRRATPGCGPRTTSPRPTRRCASWCSSARSPASARPGATAAGARRCSPRRCARSPAAARRDGARTRMQRAMNDTVDEVGRVAAAEGIDCDFGQGRHVVGWRATRPSSSARRAEVDGRTRVGVRRRRLRLLDADEVRRPGRREPRRSAARTRRTARRIHPARLVRGLAEVVERLGGARSYEGTTVRGDRARRRAHRPRRRSARRVVVRATEGYTAAAARARAATSSRCTR